METIERFLKQIMKNNYMINENEQFIKYTNNNYDIIQQKTKEGKKESCIVIDKLRNKNQIIVYNNISIAFDNIIKKTNI
jgi:hypothetical protein